MNIAAARSAPEHRRSNAVPGWIIESDEYRRLTGFGLRTLQAIADAADWPDQAGNLIGAYGGRRLIERIGCRRSTFWRNLARLVEAEFVVPLLIGGPSASDGRNYANVYGIPGTPGGLDAVRAARERRAVELGADGIGRPVVVARNDQPTFWPLYAAGGAVRFSDRGRPKIGLGSSDSRTTAVRKIGHHHFHSPIPKPIERSWT